MPDFQQRRIDVAKPRKGRLHLTVVGRLKPQRGGADVRGVLPIRNVGFADSLSGIAALSPTYAVAASAVRGEYGSVRNVGSAPSALEPTCGPSGLMR